MELTRMGDEKTKSFPSSLNFLTERNHFARKKSNKTQTHQSRAKYKLYLIFLHSPNKRQINAQSQISHCLHEDKNCVNESLKRQIIFLYFQDIRGNFLPDICSATHLLHFKNIQ